ncbi:hypothetical protein ACFYPB_37195 [Streptomyces olivaceoviridis]|uniref:hypothetical protein n=1 Tax=Streptomyces olivaceoviridis TaxID=1921 RepID=UPI00369E707F
MPVLAAIFSSEPWVLLSTDQAPADWGEAVDCPRSMRYSQRSFLPTAVVGRYYGEARTLLNGDFTISHRRRQDGRADARQPNPASAS